MPGWKASASGGSCTSREVQLRALRSTGWSTCGPPPTATHTLATPLAPTSPAPRSTAACSAAFGLSYLRDFDLTSTLVTFFTTCLASAVVFLLLYRLAKQLTGSRLGGVCVAGAYSFGTLAFPYSGTLYQHQTAAVFFVACFSLAFWRHRSGDERWFRPVLEGLLLGLGSGLLVCVPPDGTVHRRVLPRHPSGGRRTVLFLAGVAVGIAPLVAINAVYYGGPLTTAYQASRDYQVTTLELSWAAIARRLHFYFTDPTTGVFFYSPVLLLSVPGLLRFPRELPP